MAFRLYTSASSVQVKLKPWNPWNGVRTGLLAPSDVGLERRSFRGAGCL